MSTERLEPMTGCGILGVLKCIAGMQNVLPMIHGPLSCSSGHRLAMLYANVEPLLPTTNVTDPDIVLGSLDRLREATDEAWKKYKPALLVIILTCATSMTGEDYSIVAEEYEKKYGSMAIVIDGGALTGDEMDTPYELYECLKNKLGLKEENGDSITIEGLARTDYGFDNEYPALCALISEATGRKVIPGLFSGMDICDEEQLSEYSQALKIKAGLLWRLDKTATPAPFGIEGTRRFIKSVSKLNEESPKARELYLNTKQKLEADIKKLKEKKIAVGIEGAAWQAYGIADFLKNELGCRVLLSVDSENQNLPWKEVCDEFYEDVGRFELVELMKEFGAKLVFGSSNIQSDGKWNYCPFFQPVWRNVEPEGPLMGYDGAEKIVRLLLKLEGDKE